MNSIHGLGMDVVEVRFKIRTDRHKEKQLDVIHSLLGAYRMNGQVLGREFAIFENSHEYTTHLKLPDGDSLEDKYNNKYANRDIEKLSKIGLKQPKITKLGEDAEAAPVCRCGADNGYILYTSYVSLESPLRCFDCFSTIPLYWIPKTEEDYYDILNWQSNYQSCDQLQMNCTVGERFALNQMLQFDSALTNHGLEICRKISQMTNKDTYYYLYKWNSKSIKSEKARMCPSCGEEWLLSQDLHGMFDFRCNKCLLLSNIASDVH